VLNLTRKNTTFNSHAPNLTVDGPVRLGCGENKSPPLVTVRPFVRDPVPGKVHAVSPMRNGDVVTSFSADPAARAAPAGGQDDVVVGGGVDAGERASKIPTDKKSSSSVENNSSEESGVGDDHRSSSSSSSSSESEMANEDKFSDTLSADENDAARTTTFNDDDDVKLSTDDVDVVVGLSVGFEREASTSLSSVDDDGEASNEHSSSSSSSTSGDDDAKFEKNKSVEEEEVHHQGVRFLQLAGRFLQLLSYYCTHFYCSLNRSRSLKTSFRQNIRFSKF